MSEFLNKKQLNKLGFFKVGKNCKVSKYVRCYNLKCSIGDNTRIDDDVVLKGKIELGSNVHVARGCTFSGGLLGIKINDLATLSNFCQVFEKSDDYLGVNIPGATLSKNLKKTFSKTFQKRIILGRATIVGAFSVILPGAEIGDFSTVGAFSIVYKKIKSGFYFSNFSVRKEKNSKRNLKILKKNYKNLVKKIKNNE